MRFLSATLLAGVVALSAAPAWAHDEITPNTVPTGKPVFLTVASANERSVDMTSITVTAPAGVSLGRATRQPPGWTAQRSDAAVTWTGGAVAAENFEEWGFEVEEVGQPGPLRWSVASGFANGTSDTHEVEVVAVAAGAEPVPSVTQPGASAPTTLTAVATTVPGATAASGGNGDDDRATVALVVGIAAAVLAVVAMVMSARARRSPARGRSGPAEGGQDW